MRRIVVALVLVVVVAGALVWRLQTLDDILLTDHVHMLTGIGGNVGVLLTSAGPVVVDTMTFVLQGNSIRALVHDLDPKPVVAILNTHYHRDHTHGNPAFPPGTRVVATERTLAHLRERDATYWTSERAEAMLPNETLGEGTKELRIGDRTVRVQFLGRGHTDGDMVVLFVEDRVVHTGDLVFNGFYPRVDRDAGGSVREWVGTLDRVLALPFDVAIPGHGPPTNRAGIERFRNFLTSLWTQTLTLRDRGGSVEDAIRLVNVDEFGLRPLWFAPMLNRGSVIRSTWEEAMASPRGKR